MVRAGVMSDSERITVRIQADKLGALQALVDGGKFPTISDAIRAAIDSFIETNFFRKITRIIGIGNDFFIIYKNNYEVICLRIATDNQTLTINDRIIFWRSNGQLTSVYLFIISMIIQHFLDLIFLRFTNATTTLINSKSN